MNSKVIVLGPGRNTRGGISMVIKEYENTRLWKDFNCKWIETYIDKNNFLKVTYFLKGYIIYILNILRYNIIHIHISWNTTAIRKIFFFILAKALNRKIVLHVHSGAEPIINSKIQFPYRFMFKHADVSVFLANRIKEDLNKHFYIKNSTVLYNPCLHYKTKSPSTVIVKEKYILFAGTITEKKGYLDLIQAFSLIATKHSEWKLIFAGNGEIENAKHLARLQGIEGQVVFKGWLNRDEMQSLFEKSSIFCLPSYTEGFPMAVLDAWAFGLPVITTPVGGLPDILVPGTNALVFEPGDIKMLSVHLNELIINNVLRQRISEESIKLSHGPFSIETISKQLNELYSSLA